MTKYEKTSVEQAYKVIRSKIAKGELCPGMRISQRKLASEIGCSQVPVAEAMRRLESDGLLVKEPLKMAKVREFLPADWEGLYLIREGLESVASRLCAVRITDLQIRELLEIGKKLERAICEGNSDDSRQLDVELHRFIFRCAQCPLLEEELERLSLLEHTAAHQRTHGPEKETLVNSHRALIRAIADKDPDSAEYLAKKHVTTGLDEIMSEFKR